MKLNIIFGLIVCLFLCNTSLFGQSDEELKVYFQEAYETHPELPDGVLEAISFHTTRLFHRQPNESVTPCSGAPHIYGMMGLVEDGKGMINNTIQDVSLASGYSIQELKDSPRINILGTAKYIAGKARSKHLDKTEIEEWIPYMEAYLGIPDESYVARFLKDNFIWVVLNEMKNGVNFRGTTFTYPNESVYPKTYFNQETLQVLQQKMVSLDINDSETLDPEGLQEMDSDDESIDFEDDGSVVSSFSSSTDYGPATWLASPCHSSRNGASITDVVIHDMEGHFTYVTYTMFHNCNFSASSHYTLRSSDGYIVQLIREYRKAWHVGNGNPYSIGLEHEGFALQSGWYTTAMYNSSAALVKDITQSGYGIAPTSCYNGPSNTAHQIDPQPTSVRIKGHCHYPLSINSNGHWDPGPNWNWPLYYGLINGGTTGGGGGCDPNLTFNGTIPNGTHKASVSINSAGKVYSAGNVTFRSNKIKLNPGFKVYGGGIFKAINATCTSMNDGSQEQMGSGLSQRGEEENSFLLADDMLKITPNPLNDFTNIRFAIEEDSQVRLFISNAQGEVVGELMNQHSDRGEYQVEFAADDLANGVYYCTIVVNNKVKTAKMVILR